VADRKTRKRPGVTCAENGPYIVKGLTTFTGLRGEPIKAKSTLALCRCGESKNKPFCDGTHAKIGFDSARQGDSLPDRRDTKSLGRNPTKNCSPTLHNRTLSTRAPAFRGGRTICGCSCKPA